jgi:hypothetical protein
MKFEAADPKKGMTVEELKTFADRIEGLVEATGKNPADVKVKAWVNIGAGIKSLEV